MGERVIPWLLTAVPREHGAFRRRVRIVETLRSRPTSVWRCVLDGREFLLGETGVGGDSTRATLDWLALKTTPRFVFLAGFCGALAEDLKVGDGVLASGVVDPSGSHLFATLAFSGTCRVGKLLTCDRLIGRPEEKQRLALAHGAVTVDMETSHVAAWCQGRRVPWGCVRVVSDDARTPISNAVFDLLEGGRVSPWRLTKALVRRPMLARELWQLGRATATASRTIAEVLFDVVQHWKGEAPAEP